MKRLVVLMVAMSTASAAFAQVDGSLSVDAPKTTRMSQSAPRQMAGPVHIRFRTAGDINLVAGTDEAEVRRELAYHAALRTEHAND